MGHRRRRRRDRAPGGAEHRGREGGRRPEHLPRADRPRHPGAARHDRPRHRALAAHPAGQRPPGNGADVVELHRLHPGRDGRLHGHRDRLEHGRGGDRPAPARAPLDHVRGRRGVRDLRLPAVGGAVGAAGEAGDRPAGAQLARPAARLSEDRHAGTAHLGPRLQGRRRPRRRAGGAPRPAADDHPGAGLLRRDPGGDDPDHRHERGHHRRVPPDVLDGAAPPAPGGHPARAPTVQHALRRDHPLQRRRGGADGPAGRDRLPREPVRLRRHALVHARARVGDQDAPRDGVR